jgi:PKD repeat protein
MHGRWKLVASATAAIVLWPVATSSASVAIAARPVATSSVAAASTQLHGKHPASIVPLRTAKRPAGFDSVFNNMDYNGGPVMPSNTDYMVLWSPGGLGAYPATYVSGLKRWFTDLAHDSGGNQNTDSVSAQYQDLTGAFSRYATKFGGAVLDTDPYPATQCPVNSPVTACLTDPQIQQELVNFTAANNLKTDLSHEYFLLTPPHVETCFTNDPTSTPPFGACSAGEVPATLALFCAYHQNTSLSRFLIYANDPFVPGNPGCDDGNHPNGLLSDGELSGGLSHEQNESVTDPVVNDAWTNGAGPMQGFEVGDQCDGQMGTPLGKHLGALYNQVINGHFYWYQEEWSNQGHTCLQRLTPSGTKPTATFTVTKGSGLTLNFNAAGSSTSSGFIVYVWQFNAVLNAQTIETTSPTISYTFPTAGAYSVGLTVFAIDGSSTGTGAIVTTGHSGFSRGFTFSPTHPKASHTVTFSALATVSAQPVLTYLWEFGDGSTGSGAHPTHVYAAASTYTVTLVMFSGVGSAFPGQGAGPITTQKITVK